MNIYIYIYTHMCITKYICIYLYTYLHTQHMYTYICKLQHLRWAAWSRTLLPPRLFLLLATPTRYLDLPSILPHCNTLQYF